MKKYLLSGCIAMALVLSSAVLAEDAAPKKEKQAHKAEANKAKLSAFSGEITAVDATAGSLTVKGGEETKTFKCAADCKVATAEKAKEATIADLKVGDKVTVGYADESGTLSAKKIGPIKVKKEKKDAAH